MRQPAQCVTIEKLVPWYVNGTLDQDDMMLVDHHIQGCEQCRSNIETELQFSRNYGRFTNPNSTSAPQTESLLNNLLTRLPAQSAPVHPKPHHVGLALAAMVIIAIGVFALLDTPRSQTDYRTLTVPTGQVRGTILQIVFQPGTREAEIRKLVSENAAHFTSGPTPQGVYRIQLAEGMEQRDRDALIAQLRANPTVLLVEAELK